MNGTDGTDQTFYNPESDMFASRSELRDYYRFSGYYERLGDAEIAVLAADAGLPEGSNRYSMDEGLATLVAFDNRAPGVSRDEVDALLSLNDRSYDDAVDHAMHHGLLVSVDRAFEANLRAVGAGGRNGRNEAALLLLQQRDLERERATPGERDLGES